MKYAVKPTDIYVISPQDVPDKLKKKKKKIHEENDSKI